jgi:cyclase
VLQPRIIPCLLIRDGGLVKTVGFSNPKYVGDPINAVKIFNEKLVDELLVIDIDASTHCREPDYSLLKNIAAESRMPLCYGGGIKTVDQAKTLIGLGIEKIAISSAAINDPQLINQIAKELGSQSVVVVLDVKINKNGIYEVWTHNGTINSMRTAQEVAIESEMLGAGEIVLNSIANDGCMCGYDFAVAEQVKEFINVPLTLLGGAGSLDHIGEVIKKFGLVGIAAGSLFVFKGVYRAVLINYPNEVERNNLRIENISSIKA